MAALSLHCIIGHGFYKAKRMLGIALTNVKRFGRVRMHSASDVLSRIDACPSA